MAIGSLGDSVTPIPPVHQEESDRRVPVRDEAERYGCSYHSVRALPGVHQEPRWWGRCRVAGIRREARCGECESVGLALASERVESRSVRVHSPKSASGCDRSYLLRYRVIQSSRSSESRAIVVEDRERARARGAQPFSSRRSDPLLPIASDRTTSD